MEMHSPRNQDSEMARRTDTFSGAVWGQMVLEAVPNLRYNNIAFGPGARTYWHSHADGQILLVRSGVGVIRARGGDETTISEGDTLWVSPGEVHYHGAALGQHMTHHALSFGETEWFEEVSDDEYGHG